MWPSYYYTLLRRLGAETLRFGKEQVIALLIAVATLALQIRYGLVKRGDWQPSVLTILEPYLILLGVFLLYESWRAQALLWLEEKTKKDLSLAGRAEGIALDLLAYLKAKGDAPKWPDKQDSGQKWTHFWEKHRPYEQSVDAGYSAHFAERASRLRHEIQESQFNTYDLDALVDAKAHGSKTVVQLADEFLRVSWALRKIDLIGKRDEGPFSST